MMKIVGFLMTTQDERQKYFIMMSELSFLL